METPDAHESNQPPQTGPIPIGELLKDGLPPLDPAAEATRRAAARRAVIARELTALGISYQDLVAMRLAGTPTDPHEADRVEGALGAAIIEADQLGIPLPPENNAPPAAEDR